MLGNCLVRGVWWTFKYDEWKITNNYFFKKSVNKRSIVVFL